MPIVTLSVVNSLHGHVASARTISVQTMVPRFKFDQRVSLRRNLAAGILKHKTLTLTLTQNMLYRTSQHRNVACRHLHTTHSPERHRTRLFLPWVGDARGAFCSPGRKTLLQIDSSFINRRGILSTAIFILYIPPSLAFCRGNRRGIASGKTGGRWLHLEIGVLSLLLLQ